jgi:hypothetical protein
VAQPDPCTDLPIEVRLDPDAPPGDVIGALAALLLRRARQKLAAGAPAEGCNTDVCRGNMEKATAAE